MQDPTIVTRIQELNKWQAEQKRLLNERQNLQRKLLGMEHRNMYQMLGLLHPSDTETDNTHTNSKATAAQALAPAKVNEEQNGALEHISELEVPAEQDESVQATLTQRTSGYSTEEPSADIAALDGGKSKRAFLKRGAGLKQRFKMHPDEFRLDKLPRYKFASTHPSVTSLRTRSSTESIKAQPNQLTPTASATATAHLDAQEKRFQQLLFSSTNVCSSTPDTKSVIASFECIATSQKVRLNQLGDNKSSTSAANVNAVSEQSSGVNGNISKELGPISWAKVLDSQQIKPTIVNEIRATASTNPSSNLLQLSTSNEKQQLQDSSLENTSLFELLEQRAKEGSFDVNSSCLRNFMRRKIEQHVATIDADKIPVSEQLKECGLHPQVEEVFRRDKGGANLLDDSSSASSSSSEDNDQDESKEDNSTKQSNECNDDNVIAESQAEEKPPSLTKVSYHVRFSDDDTTTTQAVNTTTDTSAVVTENTTLNNTELFEQLKNAVFSALQSKANQVTNDGPQPTEDLQEMTSLIKQRLALLEYEITACREETSELIKSKQEHELEKTKFAQERFEMIERLNDEKIQLEIYLHDERMKLEAEKRKFEQKIRTFKTTQNAMERKEVLRMKQELDELHMQSKLKEQQHVAAQARLRAKMRNLEKDQKHLLDDIENLKKENKRLENENLRISRENNNKMLVEINKNIAKLAAPKVAPIRTYLDEPNDAPKKPSALSKSNNVKKTGWDAKSENPTNKKSVANETKTHKANYKCARGDSGGDTLANSNAIEPITTNSIIEGHEDNNGNDSIIANAHVKNSSDSNNSKVSTTDFKREIINVDGSKDVWYPNGNLKKISADGMNIRMLYFNKDIKETNINEGTIKYYYSGTNTWHTTYLDGLEILEFPNGQTEHRYKDGTVEVHFPNNTVKVVNPSDESKLEEWRFGDGTSLLQLRNGDRILLFSNGQKEIHTKLNKRREYPDGTVKLVYPDGSQETRYSNGRIRLKDKDGNLIMDTDAINQK